MYIRFSFHFTYDTDEEIIDFKICLSIISNNVILFYPYIFKWFFCKQFYASVIVKEVGLGLNITNNTYSEIYNTRIDEITNTNIEDLKSKFGVNNIAIDNHCLPNMYWLPRMHKTPIKVRFIVNSPKSLAKAITSAFQLLTDFKQVEKYSDKCRFFTGVNTFWVIQNNRPVIDTINKLNKRNKAKSISAFDFSTLYANLLHDKLLSILHKLIGFSFNGGEHKFITISTFRVY